jgi:hypothetical protein
MASAAKTIDFATNILKYMASGQDLPQINQVYVALLSAIPSDKNLGDPPYSGADIALCEVSAGDYRVALGQNKLVSISEDPNTDSMQIISDGGSIDWPDAPANFNVSGYALCSDVASIASSAYLAYELFDGTNKGRSINAGDSIKINAGGLVIKEK